MWDQFRTRLGSDWRTIVVTLLAANLVFVLLLQMQRTAIHDQQMKVTSGLNDAIAGLHSRDDARKLEANAAKMDVLAHFKQVELGTDQIPTLAAAQTTAIATLQKTLNDVMAHLAQIELGTNQIPALAKQQADTSAAANQRMTEVIAHIDQIALGTNQIPALAAAQAASIDRIEKGLADALARLARLEARLPAQPASGAAEPPKPAQP